MAEPLDFAALARERAARAGRNPDSVTKAAPGPKQETSASSGGGVTSAQKALFILAAIMVGPALLQQLYEKVSAEKVDLSDFNLVTNYDTPAIDMMDNTVRIQFCAN